MLEKSNQSKVSVLIPVYNVEKYVERCLLSVLNQTMQEGVEVIIVNDCTPDRSMEIIHEVLRIHLKENGMMVRIVEHDTNRGLAAVRNTAMSYATGNYTIHVDSDDYIEPDMLEKMYSKAIETNSDIVIVDYWRSYLNENKYMNMKPPRKKEDILRDLIRHSKNGFLWNKLIRRNLWLHNNVRSLEGVNFYEDYIVMIQLFYAADRIEHLPYALYYYVKYNENSYNHNYNEKVLNDMLSSVHFTFAFIKSKALMDFQYDAIYRALNIKNSCMSLAQKKQRKVYSDLYSELYEYKVRFLLDWKQSVFNKFMYFFALNNYPSIFYWLLDLKKRLKN